MRTAQRVLLVEDDIDDQAFFLASINRVHPSIQCVIAHTGKEALIKVALPPPFDIIFMDLNLPGMNGFDCMKRLKDGEYRNIPIVVLSTSESQVDIERSKNLGAVMYCVKPTTLDALFQELKTILTKKIKFHLS